MNINKQKHVYCKILMFYLASVFICCSVLYGNIFNGIIKLFVPIIVFIKSVQNKLHFNIFVSGNKMQFNNFYTISQFVLIKQVVGSVMEGQKINCFSRLLNYFNKTVIIKF